MTKYSKKIPQKKNVYITHCKRCLYAYFHLKQTEYIKIKMYGRKADDLFEIILLPPYN